MKIVINDCFGGFGFSDEFSAAYPDAVCLGRTNEKLIAALEEFGLNEASSKYAELIIADIPDTATDYMILEYDGSETLYYVINGKIYEWYGD